MGRFKKIFHVFVLTYLSPPNSYFGTPSLDEVTFWKWPFDKMSGGLGKNSEPLPRSWDLGISSFSMGFYRDLGKFRTLLLFF